MMTLKRLVYDSLRGVATVLLLILFFTKSFGYQINDSLISNERKLFKYLLEEYEKSVRPVVHENDTVHVELDLELTGVEDLEEVTQAFYSTGWLRMIWNDFQLKWDESQFGGIHTIPLPVTELWTPDIFVANSLNADLGMPLQHTMAVVSSDGTVLWVPPVSLRTMCPVDLTNFPFDKQTCEIKFLSWSSSAEKINLTTWEGIDRSQGNELQYLQGNPEWQVMDYRAVNHVIVYPGIPDMAFTDITFYVTLQRMSTFALHLFLAPSVTLGLIIPAVFILPPDSGDKMIMGAGVLVAHVLLLGELIKYVPSEHITVPLMAQFFLANIVLVSLSMAISAVVINLWSRAHSRIDGPPAIIRWMFLNPVLTRLLLIDFSDYDEMGVHRDEPRHPGSVEVMSDLAADASVRMTDDRVHIMMDSQRVVARADWRGLAIVFDRIFFVLFLLLVIAISLAYIKYL